MFKEMRTPELGHPIHDYALGKLISASNLSGGYTNKNVYINTTAGEYVLRISHAARTKEEVVFEADVLKKLKQTPAGDFVVDIIETPDGSPFVIRNGHINTLFRFVKGEDFYNTWDRHNPDTHFIESLGKKCAILHRSLSNIDAPKATRESLPTRLRKYYLDLESLGLDMKPYHSLINLTEGSSLVHTDLRIRNFVVNTSEISTIIDFDDITYGNQLYDIAWIIKECFSLQQIGSQPTPVINIEATKLFLKWYQSNFEGKVNTEDIVRIMAIACLGTLHFLFFSASNSMTRERIEQLTSINLAQLDLFSKGDAIASAIVPV
ncbi:MAG: phosphotransferase [Patescibacteria group bacterium]